MSSSATPSHDFLYASSFDLAATTFASGVSWGVMTCLYAVCMNSLVRNLRSAQHTRMTAILATWITLLWILSSLCTIAAAYCTIYAYSWQLDYPGGPMVYLAEIWSHPVPFLAYSTYHLTMWFADAMMLWRLFVFYQGVNPIARGLIFVFMTVMYIGVIVSGCFTIAFESSGLPLFSEYAKKAAIPSFTLSVTLNVLATTFISARLFMFKRLAARTLGHKQAQASPYTSVAAMLIESSALYATWSLVFIVLYASNNPGQWVMLMTLCSIQVIAPTLIVYRVSQGLGWERKTSARLTSTLMASEGRGRSQTMLEISRSEHHGSEGSKKMMALDSNESAAESKRSVGAAES